MARRSDAPLGEERELYRLTIASDGGAARIVECDIPALILAGSDRAETLTIAVRQAGTHGLSPPATMILPAMGGE